ncbi:DUF1109 domain-containing protein [Pseudooceanicola sp. CBS1P-1]|uniref:DUF1109 family protein n=2 Tax=Paracoccaceae TaxID=31989 RepID=A0A6L7G0P1_9RHOB|nr:DUF1109 domain-containing protein [Pseudooceanicola endophyticus]MXN17262.1 DUF1109 family protein [Pseudooceanicola albus]
MDTEELIARLAQDPAPAPDAGVETRFLPFLLVGLLVSVALYFAALGPRPGLLEALKTPLVVAKTLLPAVLAGLALVLARRSARPGRRPGLPARLIWAVPLAALALFGLAFAQTPADMRLGYFLGHSIQLCMPAIATLSLPVTAGLILALRRGAPVRPVRTGALAGLAAGALATVVYSTFCTEDSPLFYSVWYSGGIALGAGIGALAGAKWLRW